MERTNLRQTNPPERYLIDFDAAKLPTEHFDVVIIGSGIAGVYTALTLSRSARVLILTKEASDESNSVLAQGGIAVSLGQEDSPELHFRDTLYAGAGINDEETVWAMVREAADNIAQLCLYGVNFDRGENRQLALTREAAHSRNRIIHTGDATGREVCSTLIAAVHKLNNVEIRERWFVVDIVTEGGPDAESTGIGGSAAGACERSGQATGASERSGHASGGASAPVARGVLAWDEETRTTRLIVAPVVVCASGGYGRLYASTTNPEVATGDGAAMALRAGAELMDLEFVQFHPTVLFHEDEKNFLISEAVRGEGAILRNKDGERFMPRYHELAELAPRDVVSRSIFSEMRATGTEHVWLDITHRDAEWLERRFPTITKTCLSHGIDISKQWIPVAPSQHYSMGGIRTDEWGLTSVGGLYAVGEAACNGIHGANRLASNSLLEGLVFGRRISRLVNDRLAEIQEKFGLPVEAAFVGTAKTPAEGAAEDIALLQRTMTRLVGIVRCEADLLEAIAVVARLRAKWRNAAATDSHEMELKNMILLAEWVATAALARTESRGAHCRSDYPATDDARWQRNLVVLPAGAGVAASPLNQEPGSPAEGAARSDAGAVAAFDGALFTEAEENEAGRY